MSTAYGHWSLVIINAAIFILFAFSFTHPKTRRDWRSFGAFSAFIMALFTEMYGFPLTIYLLSGSLGNRYAGKDLFSHDAGHLWHTLHGWQGNPHTDPLHMMSGIIIAGGFLLLASAWSVLHAAQRGRTLASTGSYAVIRHPQYVGFFLIMFGFLLQWPTLPTVVMFPVLMVMYYRLAKREERDALSAFEESYERYRAATPAFVPSFRGPSRLSRSGREGRREDQPLGLNPSGVVSSIS